MKRNCRNPNRTKVRFPRARWLRLSTVVAALLTLNFLARFAAPVQAQNAQIKLQAQIGYDSYYRENQWFPILVSVSNSGPDVSGELRVDSADTNGLTAGTYATHVDLPNGSSKQIFLYISLATTYTQSVHVQLVSTEGGILAEDVSQPKNLKPENHLYVVITESPRGTVDLKNVQMGNSTTQQVNWRIENIPDNAQALESIDMMVFTDVDTGRLSVPQRNAIADWLTSGGHLVVTGGPNWQKTQVGLTNLLPLQPDSSTTLTNFPGLAAYAGHPTDQLSAPQGGPVIAAQGKLASDAQVLLNESSVALLTRHQVGQGNADYLAIDPGLEPFPSWSNHNDFWLSLVTSIAPQPNWSNGLVAVSNATVAANLIKGVRLPDVFQLCGFLLVYIIVIGPLNYLFLKRIGRRELAWITIPIIIFSCSVVAYVTGFSLRGTQATINRLALVQAWPNNNRAKVTGLIGVLAPRRSVYTVSLNNGTLLSSIDDSGNPTGGFAPRIVQGQQYRAENVPVDAGLTAVFSTEGYTEVKPIDGSAQIQLFETNGNAVRRTGANAPHVTGSITNTTDITFHDAVVIGMGGNRVLGTVAPGNTLPFDFVLSPPGYQASPVTPSSLQSFRYLNSTYYRNGNYYNNVEPTVQDIMGNTYQNYYGSYGGNLGYGDNPDTQEYRRRQSFLRAMIRDLDPNGGRGTDIYFVGWTSTSPLDIELNGASFQTEDTTLYIYRLPSTIKPTSNEVELPSVLQTWTSPSTSSQQDISPYNLTVIQGTQAQFRFIPLSSVHLKEVTRLNINLQGQTYTQATISLWDWTAQKWVDANANNSLTNINDPQRFIGPGNSVLLQVEPVSGVRDVTYDRVDVSLYGKLDIQGQNE